MARCKGCGAEIVWIKTTAGKALPCDAPLVMYAARKGAKGRSVTPSGAILAADVVDDPAQAHGVGHIAHWATCPAARQFRKKVSA